MLLAAPLRLKTATRDYFHYKMMIMTIPPPQQNAILHFNDDNNYTKQNTEKVDASVRLYRGTYFMYINQWVSLYEDFHW